MKLMYALWGEGLDAWLHGAELRRRLADIGGYELQVNVRDAEVAGAQLRHTTYAEPIAAIVSVRTLGGHETVTAALGSVADEVQGWMVDERRPIVPPQVEDGVRTDALANVALLRIPADLTREEWLHRWHDLHTPVAIETQATFGYVQNTVAEAITPGKRVDALVEELFPMAAMASPHEFYGSGGDDAELQRRITRLMESVVSFGAHLDLDIVPTSRYVYKLS
ncbi:EthD domain-containing protein [Nocardia huaxiensis]|uniref:EthD domain-containing protein n=1 Tax=Nocardia huaxiensis TaxID=2755382 RepID=A0A7D6ZUR4_9NOCA|nr:EthD domain-containing protein [Nocardia huaxiensis]QLY29169.1 EthD domain-containing protein [Nocardia huaxiensis]UFS97334.1 EthD domain-containing protein [Nocardia huaxiensis]